MNERKISLSLTKRQARVLCRLLRAIEDITDYGNDYETAEIAGKLQWALDHLEAQTSIRTHRRTLADGTVKEYSYPRTPGQTANDG